MDHHRLRESALPPDHLPQGILRRVLRHLHPDGTGLEPRLAPGLARRPTSPESVSLSGPGIRRHHSLVKNGAEWPRFQWWGGDYRM